MDDELGCLTMIVVLTIAVIAGGWLFIKLVGCCIFLVYVCLGTSTEVAVVGGFFLAVGLTIYVLLRSNK